MLAGFALAVNTFYGQAPLYWAVLFFGLAVTAATFLNYLHREDAWERAGVDYSSEVRLDLFFYAAGLSLGIMSLAMALPVGAPPNALLAARNWRSVSYDVYTGRGWARSSERDEAVEAGQPIPAAEAAAQITLTQTVDWVHDRRATRYTVGRPAVFSHDAVSYTHLDVYKRQGWASCPPSSTTAAPD